MSDTESSSVLHSASLVFSLRAWFIRQYCNTHGRTEGSTNTTHNNSYYVGAASRSRNEQLVRILVKSTTLS